MDRVKLKLINVRHWRHDIVTFVSSNQKGDKRRIQWQQGWNENLDSEAQNKKPAKNVI